MVQSHSWLLIRWKKKTKKIYFLLSFRPVKLAGLQGRQKNPHFYFLNSNNYSRCRHLLSKVVEIQTKMTFEIFVFTDRRAVGHCPGGPGRCPLQQTSILSIAIRRILSVIFLLRWSRCRWLFGRWLLFTIRIELSLLFELQSTPTVLRKTNELSLPGFTRLPTGRISRCFRMASLVTVHPFRSCWISTGKKNFFLKI